MKKVIFIMILIVVSVGFAPCNSFSQTLRLGFLTKPQTLNPVIGLTTTSGYISDLLFNSLYGIKIEGNNYILVPELAESEPKPLGHNSYEIRLRENVRWHNGNTLTSRDIIATINSIQANRDSSAVASRINKIQSVNYIDSLRFKVAFHTQVGPTEAMDILNFKVIPLSFIYNQDIPDQDVDTILSGLDYRMTTNDKFSAFPLGTGPFRMSRRRRYNSEGSNSLILERHGEYFQGAAAFNDVQIHFYSSLVAMMGDIVSGTRHLIINPPSELLPALHANSDYDLPRDGDYNGMIFIGYNWNRVGQQRDLRLGLSNHVKDLTTNWFQGIHAGAEVAIRGIVKRVFGPVTLNHCKTYGIDRVPVVRSGGDMGRLQGEKNLRILYKSYDREQRDLATHFREAFEQQNIRISLKSKGINDYYHAIRSRRGYDFVIYRIRPSNLLGRYFRDGWRTGAPFNVISYSNHEVDSLIDSLEGFQRGSTMRIEICKEIYDIIVNDFPASWLWSYKDVVAVHTGLDIGENGVNYLRPFENVNNWRHERRQ